MYLVYNFTQSDLYYDVMVYFGLYLCKIVIRICA